MDNLTPITREEMLMNDEPLTPITREEKILAGERFKPSDTQRILPQEVSPRWW